MGLLRGCVLVLIGGLFSPMVNGESFELKDGDKVVFLGNTLIERAGLYGHLETAFLTRWPDRSLTFRNLGWSADNVTGRSRDYFFKRGDGYRRLTGKINELKPTVIFVAYGTNESFAGPAGLDAFQKNLSKLLTDITKGGARLVLLSPLRQGDWAAPAQVAKNNENLKLYADAIKAEAEQRKVPFVDLYKEESLTKATYDSIHLDEKGYRVFAEVVERALGLPEIKRDDSEAIRKLVVEKNEFF